MTMLNTTLYRQTSEAMDDPTVYLLDLERDLEGPDGSQIRETLLAQFAEQLRRVELVQRNGLTPAQFSQSEALRSALHSAIRCLAIHPTNFP